MTVRVDFLADEAAGLKVTRFLQHGAIDYGKALKALLPDLDAAALETSAAASWLERANVVSQAMPLADCPIFL